MLLRYIPGPSHLVKFIRRYSSLQSMQDSALSKFLSSSKNQYLSDAQLGNGRNWTVVMGNEAGGECDDFLRNLILKVHRSRQCCVLHCIRMDQYRNSENSDGAAHPDETIRSRAAT